MAPWSLRARLAVVAALGSVLVLTVGSLLLYQDLSNHLSTAISNELAVAVDDVSAGAASGESTLVTVQLIETDGDVRMPAGAEPLLTRDELTRASRDQIVVNRPVPGVGAEARLLARPAGTAGGGQLVAVAATGTTPLTEARHRLVVVLAFAGPVLTVAVGVAAWLLTGAALRPVRRMADEASTISAAQVGRRLPEPAGTDEIAALGHTLNAMLERIEKAVANERAFIDDAAHELRTPIAVLRGELELTGGEELPEPVAESLANALEETDRLTRLAENLLTLARADAGQLGPGEATSDLFATARATVRRVAHRKEVRVEVRGEPLLVRGDAEWVGAIIGNLVTNADRHARSRILVTVTQADGWARLVVADDGPGFPPSLLPRAFDRFARGEGTRGRPGGGAGLGLAIVASLTDALGGAVTAGNGPPFGGGRIVADLPLAVPSPAHER
ncbi:ATP-binding protein [Micromonospora sp. KC213]|uniref:ATP-binding protein n=1 Tax=Micromonospora sp. KC213 TaxID=2530378 RepID=UPI001052EC2E|nr:ATP-binding protein [Micromonospora sp. KC213]TDC40016.1 HAMP domain-containing protein [Micromonospora sp. KC213]